MSSEDAASSAAATTASSSAAAAAAPTVARTLAEMQADPRYIQGKALIKQHKYDEAIDFLGTLVGVVTGEGGDETSVGAGAVYFAYGDALLCKVEESADLFGEGVKKAEAAKQGEGAEGDDDDDDEEEEEEEGASAAASSSAAASAEGGEGGEVEGDVEKVQISTDVQEDLEVAWENLEAARVIYVKHEAEVGPKNLGEVYLRLGDLQKTNGNYMQAIDDYHKALRLYTLGVPEDDRNIADLHYLLATSFIYASADQPEKVVEFKQQALEHFSKCAKVFEMKLAKAKAQAAEEEAAASGSGKAPAPKPGEAPEPGKAAKDATEFAELLEELRETIEATAEEIRREQAAPGSTSAKAAAPVTTIGFGDATAAAAAAAQGGAASTNGATASSSSAAASASPAATGTAAAQPAAVNVMAVKKKPKPAPSAVPAVAAPAAGNGAENGGSKSEPEQEAGKKRPLEGVQGPAMEEGPAEAVVPQPVAKEARVE